MGYEDILNVPEYEDHLKEMAELERSTRLGIHPELDESVGAVNIYLGKKHDQSKPDLSLLPREFLDEVSKAFMHGEKKYGRYNYLGGMDWHRLVGAALRHLTAFNDGEDLDPESGNSHLGHAGASIAMLLVYIKRNLGKDTRHKGASDAYDSQ